MSLSESYTYIEKAAVVHVKQKMGLQHTTVVLVCRFVYKRHVKLTDTFVQVLRDVKIFGLTFVPY